MYLPAKGMGRRITTVALGMLLGMSALTAYGQDSGAQNSDSNAKPVLPASDANSGKSVAKAGALPSTDAPTPRVANVRPDTYIIGVGDSLDINVWKEPELSKGSPVRPDGMITMPLIGEIKAVGLTPIQLQDQISTALQKVMSEPQVTVMVASVNSLSFNIMGQVNKPGFYPLTRPLTVLDAIALSAGFRDFAKQKKIYVLRTMPDGTQQKLKFNYKDVIKGKNMAQNITLQPRDTLVIP
jgi:polysaccharide export outer membrane protein